MLERAGAIADIWLAKNLTPNDIEETIEEMVRSINEVQIVMLPGGFSGGDEPDGSGKFIATTFRNPKIRGRCQQSLEHRDGLMLGIRGNGFQALIKLGLVPYGKITEPGAHRLQLNVQYHWTSYFPYGIHKSNFCKISVVVRCKCRRCLQCLFLTVGTFCCKRS